MITIPKDISPELKAELKRWFVIAKQNKMITTLYILDNILKNTKGYPETGITAMAESTLRCHQLNKDKDLLHTFQLQKNRFKYNKVNFFNSIHKDYFLQDAKHE